MRWRRRGLVAAIPFVVTASPSANAETHQGANLVVHSDSPCPSGQAVAEAVWAIRPDGEWRALLATLHVGSDRVQVALGKDRKNWREIPVSTDCAERADQVALVIAVWAGELPEHATSGPSLSVAVPAPAPMPHRRPATVTELGITGFYSMVGGLAPGALIELGRFRRAGWWGMRGVAGYQSAKSLQVDIGISRYDRALLGATMVLHWHRPWVFLAGDLGLVGSFTRARGEGYSQDESASGLNVGLAADARAGLSVRAFRVWADGRLQRWARKETIRVDSLSTGPSSLSTLPAWDAQVGLGAGVVFD